MDRKALLLLCFIVGALFVVFSLMGRRPSLLGFFIGIVILGVGLGARRGAASGTSKNSLPPPVPSGFNATHWHQNIAIDSETRKLWIRDETGTTVVLDPGQVLGWSLESKEVSKGFVAGNMVVSNAQQLHAYSKLLIKTSDLDRPVWKVKFNAHTDHLAAGGNANYREMQEWSDRLSAFYHR